LFKPNQYKSHKYCEEGIVRKMPVVSLLECQKRFCTESAWQNILVKIRLPNGFMSVAQF